jgi:hypothetical protein
LYHIWWDNAAMIRLFEQNPEDNAKIHTLREHWIMNSYLYGLQGATDISTRLYKHGDFLVHFAGVYDSKLINSLMKYVLEQYKKNEPLNLLQLDDWRKEN